jgi:hypothetical protein
MVRRVSGPFRRGLLALSLAGLSLRLLFLVLEPATAPVADETVWIRWGTELVREAGFSPFAHRLIFHPPLYPHLIGALDAVFGSLAAIKLAQCLLGAALVPALGLLGARAFGERPAIMAAALGALYPELVWFCAHFWAETLFLALLWWGLERLLAADGRASHVAAAVSGLLLGLAVLTRETILYFLPLAALWLAWRRAGGLARAAVLLGTALIVVVPWTLRNAIVFRAFVPVSTAGALNLYQGNAPLTREEVYERYWAVKGPIERYRFAGSEGLKAIAGRQPLWLLEKLLQELPHFWEADSQALVHVVRGAYGEVSAAAAVAAVLVLLVPYVLVLALFVVGLAHVPVSRASVLLLGFLLFYLLLHVASHGYARYRLPVLPILFLVGACGWTAWGRASVTALRRLVAVVAALVLAASLAPSLASWFTDPWMERAVRPEAGEEP